MTGLKTDKQYSIDLDNKDPLKKFRQQFHIPEKTIYLNGNSLGLLTKESEKSIKRALEEWQKKAINGWWTGDSPWLHYAESLGAMCSSLVGAEENEVIMTGTTTVNIYSVLSTFYKAKDNRTKILADTLNFPTDNYALVSFLELKGLNPKDHLIYAPIDSNGLLDEKEIVKLMTDDIALVFLPSALYRSGQLLDMEYLTKEAHERGIPIGFDCSHSVGAVPHKFDEWEVDFAVWCSYKYLNSGPGAPAFTYINKKHFSKTPGMTGWFGYVKEKQFDLLLDFEHQQSAAGWQLSSPGILSAAGIEGSLKVTLEAGIENIRKKSLQMTNYLIFLADEILKPYSANVETPRDDNRRTGHVAISHESAEIIVKQLTKMKVITDFRPPNIIRIAPSALYNTFTELWEIVHKIKVIIDL